MTRAVVALSFWLVAGACGARGPDHPGQGEEARFRAEADDFYWSYFAYRPNAAVTLGHHRFDGKVPDRSAGGIAGEIERLRRARASFEAYDRAKLSPTAALDREVLLAEIRVQLFDLEVRRESFRNPLSYSEALDLSPYVVRPYAPAAERARAIVAACGEVPRYLAEARANLDRKLPVTFIDTAILQLKGHIEFARDDVQKALPGLEPELAAE